MSFIPLPAFSDEMAGFWDLEWFLLRFSSSN